MFCKIYNNDNPYVDVFVPSYDYCGLDFKRRKRKAIKYKISTLKCIRDAERLSSSDYFCLLSTPFDSYYDPEKVSRIKILHFKDYSKKVSRSNFRGTVSQVTFDDLINDNSLEGSKQRFFSNLRRIVRTVFDYTCNNHFDFFCTITISPNKWNRSDLDLLFKKICQRFNYYRKKHSDFAYLIVPELHSDKRNFHFHCLLRGVSLSDLTHFSEVDYIPKKIKQYLNKGIDVYKWNFLEKRFGFNSLIRTYGEQANLAKYMTKYFTKNIYMMKSFSNVKLVRHSQNLQAPKKIMKNVPFLDSDTLVYDGPYGSLHRISYEKFLSI